MATHTHTSPPNHHGHHSPFTGATGVAVAITLSVGRGRDARLARRLTGVGPGDTVVDVGCGPGSAVRHAAATGASVIGVDPAPVMLRFARVLSIGRRRIRFVPGAAEDLPLDDGAATVLWSIATVHHWADLDAGLREARRVLAPGGRFLAIERRTEPGARGHASHGWTPAQAEAFARACEAHGFEAARVERHRTGRRDVVAVLALAPQGDG